MFELEVKQGELAAGSHKMGFLTSKTMEMIYNMPLLNTTYCGTLYSAAPYSAVQYSTVFTVQLRKWVS